MLRSLHAGMWTGLHLPEPEVVRNVALTVGKGAIITGLAFTLSRATLFELTPSCAPAPFALALFSAGLLAGVHPAPLLLGCLLGAMRGGLEGYDLALPLGCAVILAGYLGWNMLEARIGRIRSPNELCMLLAGLATLLPGLYFADGAFIPSAQVTAASVVSLASAPFLRAALADIRTGRLKGMLSESRTGLCLLGLMAVAGLCAICLPLALGACALALTLLWPVGAISGVGMGAAALLITGEGSLAALTGLCGALAQLCGEADRRVRAACVAATALILALYMKLPIEAMVGLCTGPFLSLLLPENICQRVLEHVRQPEVCPPAEPPQSDMENRLRAMSAAFGDLAEGYLTPAKLPDEQALMTSLRQALCEDCPGYAECWAGEQNKGARLLCDLVALAVEQEGETAIFDEGIPPMLSRRCRRSNQLEARVGGILEAFSSARRSELKRGGENRLISAQFLQAQRLLDALAASQSKPSQLRDETALRALSDIGLTDARFIGGQRREMALTLRDGAWSEALTRAACERLGNALGHVYEPSGVWGRTLRVKRQPKLRAEIGAVSTSREPGATCGDSHLTAMLDGDRLLALICDGMGSGEAAGRESAQAARLLGRFLAAGADWGLAVETVNALLINASAEDMFSTVDMLILNLSTGMAEFVKLSACATLIGREGGVQRVEGGRLPLGILERVQPAASRMRLMPGDTLLMASDGVMDAADTAALEALLSEPGDDMNALSERVLALAQSSASHLDDMTAICVRVHDNVPACESMSA